MAKENKRQMLVDACNEKIDELTGEKNERATAIESLLKIVGSSFAHKDNSREFADLLERAKSLGVGAKPKPKPKDK